MSLTRISRKNLLRGVLVLLIPWGPVYGFERLTFFSGASQNGLYGLFTGPRLEADAAFSALGGILIAYLLRPRYAIFQVSLSTLTVWSLFYQFCETFRGANGLLHSACYQPGPDGLAGFRLSLMMFSFAALPIFVKAAGQDGFNRKIRPLAAIFGGVIVSIVMSWFPLANWFSGASYSPLFLPFQAAILFGIPGLVCGILSARIAHSLKIAAASGIVSLLVITASLWTQLCPDCDRSLLLFAVPLWGLFSLLGGVLELGRIRNLPWSHGRAFLSRAPTLHQIALAITIVLALWTAIAYPFWLPSVLYSPQIQPGPGPLYLGLPIYRPYVAGYYNSTQYRICCLEVGISFAKADPSLIGPGNFLMAGMGVQSPNCCIDGWDFGWRADVFLLHNGTLLVSASSWETCDSNANCGGNFWQHLRYHVQKPINPPTQSTPIFLRMMWENGQANWYYNYTGVPWQKLGGLTPDFREAPYFDIGVIGPGHGQDFNLDTYFFQFGVGSKSPVTGWSVQFLDPSFQLQGSWRLMEKAAVIQGDLSFWKTAYRWGGAPYPGVTAQANALDASFPKDSVEFSYTGGTLKNNTPLW